MFRTIKKTTKCFKLLSILVLALFFSACVKTDPQIPDEALQGHAQEALQKFVASMASYTKNTIKPLSQQPYSLTGSIRFTANDSSNRATYLLWGNGNHPLRFDLQAGIGSSVAKIMESEKDMLLYFPLDKKAVFTLTKTALNNLLNLDAPIPLTFLDLSFLARGAVPDYLHNALALNVNNTNKEDHANEKNLSLATIVTERLEFSQKLSSSGKYAFNWQKKSQNKEVNTDFIKKAPFFKTIVLNPQGLPIQYIIQDDWKVDVEYIEVEKNQKKIQIPYRIKIQSLENDSNIILLVKENNDVPPYTEEQLKLILPKDTSIETYNF